MSKSELPSLSKELDKFLVSEIVPGEVTTEDGHFYAAFALSLKEYANTPPLDLWAFHIQPALEMLAKAINEYASKLCVRTPGLPPENAVTAAFISSDGKVPIRLMVIRREPSANFPDDHMLFTIDILTQKAV